MATCLICEERLVEISSTAFELCSRNDDGWTEPIYIS